MNLSPCVRGRRCAAAVYDTTREETTGALTRNNFCDQCTDHIVSRIRDLPVVYRELRELYGIQPTLGGDDVQVKVSRVDPSIPVREDLDVILTDLEQTVNAYEDRVRQHLSMPPAPASSWAHRPDRIREACALLAAHPNVLLNLPMEWMAIDGSHDERGGVDAGLDLLAVHHRADRAGGSQPVRYVVPVVCPACRLPAGVTREAGRDGAVCVCGYVMGEDEYRALTAVLADSARRVGA